MGQNGLANALLLTLQSRFWESSRCGILCYYSLIFHARLCGTPTVTGYNIPFFLTQVWSKDLVVQWDKQECYIWEEDIRANERFIVSTFSFLLSWWPTVVQTEANPSVCVLEWWREDMLLLTCHGHKPSVVLSHWDLGVFCYCSKTYPCWLKLTG